MYVYNIYIYIYMLHIHVYIYIYVCTPQLGEECQIWRRERDDLRQQLEEVVVYYINTMLYHMISY